MEFEWDGNKAEANLAKHRLSFEAAARVFADADRLVIQDRVVEGEERWQAVGVVDGAVILVAYTHRENAVRIISARPANRKERKLYGSE